MLEKYRNLIYKDLSEYHRIQNECIKLVNEWHPRCTKEDIINSIGETNDLGYDYNLALSMLEGGLLFDYAVNKFGNDLWQGKAWQNHNCHDNCPFGTVCKKQLIKINDECFCYGQLFKKNLNADNIIELATKKEIKLIDLSGETILDLNSSDYDEQLLYHFFFNYEMAIIYFGDYYIGTTVKRSVVGHNVIHHL